MDDFNELEKEYFTYNGLNRPSVIFGVPILVFLSCLVISVLSVFLLKYIGFFALIPVFICFISCIFIRVITEDDPNALPFVTLKLKGFLLKRNSILSVRGG